VIKREGARIGRVNDNDMVIYVFQATYKGIPQHRFGLSVMYFRDRYLGAAQIGQAAGATERPENDVLPGGGFLGQQTDSVMIMPGWTGSLGPLRGLLQFNVVAGTSDTTNVISAACPAGTCANRQLDIFAWGLVAYAEVKLGVVAPFAGIIYGSGDNDPTDDKLEGFNNAPTLNITGLSTGLLAFLDRAPGYATRDIESPARSRATVVGGSQFAHGVGSQFNNRLGTRSHPGINSAYSNPGTILPFVGVHVFPMKGHEIHLAYLYRAMQDSALFLQPATAAAFRDAGGGGGGLGVSVSKALYHNLYATWMWTLNPHFDIRLTGNILIPAAGAKDIARTVVSAACPAATPCQGDDPALGAEARFRARF
jgi:hypothetical protein